MRALWGPEIVLTINGWKGEIKLAGVELPNWLPVICGVAVGVLGVLGAASVWRAPAVNIVLWLYGIVHLGLVLAVFIKSSSSVGVGLPASIGSFITLLVLSIKAALPQQQTAGRAIT